MLAETYFGLDTTAWIAIGTFVSGALATIGGSIWKIVLWCAGRIDSLLERQDKFMSKLEANDAKRIDILAQISTDNAVKAAAISALSSDLADVKQDVAVLKDRLPGSRISLPGIAPGDRV